MVCVTFGVFSFTKTGAHKSFARKCRIRESTLIGDPPVYYQTETHVWAPSITEAFPIIWGVPVDVIADAAERSIPITVTNENENTDTESLIPVTFKQLKRRITVICQSAKHEAEVPITKMTTVTPWEDLPRYKATLPQSNPGLPSRIFF